mgnify:FL=1
MMKLTEPQIQAFHKTGYHIFGGLLTEVEAERMVQIYMNCLTNHQANHTSQSVQILRQNEDESSLDGAYYQLRCAHLMHPDFDAIIRNERLLDAVESLIGPNLRIVICQGLYKPPYTGGEIDWHQDDYYFRVNKPNAVISCWLTFDDATVDNGCMWVIPGAHKRMVEHEIVSSGKGFHIPNTDESKAIPIELKRGHCMLHHGLMPHRTLTNTTASHRRALAIHYMDAAARPSASRLQEPPENMPLVRGKGIEWNVNEASSI